mgnify:FL=1
MAKKKGKSDTELFDELVRKCEESYAEWDSLYRNGCQDPFWEDGVNLGLTRNHIIYYKAELTKLCGETGREIPPLVFRDLPPEVAGNYMARTDEIREQARQQLKRLQEFSDYKELRECCKLLSPKQREESRIDRALAEVTRLERAIKEDRLVEMRLFGRQESAFEFITKKLAEARALPGETFQLSLFDSA